MNRMTKEINKVTGTVIAVSGKLILYAAVLLLLFEGMTKGYAFGHEIFYATAVEQGEGTDKNVSIPRGQSAKETAHMLKQSGLIGNELAFRVQKEFYDYEIYPGTYTLNTAMTSKEILQLLNEKPEETETGEEDGGEAETGAAAVEIQADGAESGGNQ